MVRLRVSSTDHTDTTSHRIRQDPINLRVGDEFQIDTGLLENGVPRELWRTEVLSRIQFLVVLLSQQQLRLVIESRDTINLVYEWLNADRAKLIDCIGEDQNFTRNRKGKRVDRRLTGGYDVRGVEVYAVGWVGECGSEMESNDLFLIDGQG